jgi:hypothetical protein
MLTPRPSKLLVSAASAAALVLCAPLVGTTAAADAASSPAKLRASAFQFLLTFDNKEPLRAGTRVVDASGHKHGGVIAVHRGKITPTRGVVRRGAQFPHQGRAIIQIADRKGLDPGSRSFLFGGFIKVAASMATTGANLVQKGYYKQAGGQWKLQLLGGGVPACVINGDGGRVKAAAKRSVANGKWHKVTCSRTSTGVTVWIDGKRAGSARGATGRIASVAPVKIGGKKVKAPNKQFHGRIDSVFMRFVPAGR